jgi:dimethylhistidine N-methyltransferase
MLTTFASDVLNGLSKFPQKTLPSKYFYDKKGDDLFVQIMNLPEYYLTRAEMQILRHKTSTVVAALQLTKDCTYDIIELGAGDGVKTIELLKFLLANGYPCNYLPIDISPNALQGLAQMLHENIPDLTVLPQPGDYFHIMDKLGKNNTPKIVLFLGSNIGNLSDEEAADFIYKLGANLKEGDKIVLGVDLKKSKDIVLPAYNDAQGVTKAFNLNLLDRINRELGGDFDVAQFEHSPMYDENEGIARSYLRSKVKQRVTILDKTFEFEAGETILTEISRKYDETIIANILNKTDFSILSKIMDDQALFADYILLRH